MWELFYLYDFLKDCRCCKFRFLNLLPPSPWDGQWLSFEQTWSPFLPNDVVEIGSVAREEFYRRRDRRTHETDFVFLSTLISGTLFLAFNLPKLLDKQLYWCDSSMHHYLEFRKLSCMVRSNHLICLWKCILFCLYKMYVVDTVSAHLSWKIRWFFLIIVVCLYVLFTLDTFSTSSKEFRAPCKIRPNLIQLHKEVFSWKAPHFCKWGYM